MCDILLIALGPLAGTLSAATTPGDPVRLGVAWVDPVNANAGAVLPIPPGLPSIGELRARVRAVHDGAPTPTLAAVDLAERQAVAGGYVAPVRRAMITQPYMTYGLIAVFVVIWILEYATCHCTQRRAGRISAHGARCRMRSCIRPIGAEPGVRRHLVAPGEQCLPARPDQRVSRALQRHRDALHRQARRAALWTAGVARGIPAHRRLGWSVLGCGAARGPRAFPGSARNSISLGASGGIAGLVGLLLMLGRVQGKNVPVGITHTVRNYAVTVIVLNVVLTFVFGPSLDINNYAHIGGAHRGGAPGVGHTTTHVDRRPRSHDHREDAALGRDRVSAPSHCSFAVLNLTTRSFHRASRLPRDARG